MTQINKYGLKRYVPNPVSRVIRQRCGFGCVVCGKALYQYHHVDPPFSEAREHDPEKIVLLCLECHGRVGSFLSERTVEKSILSPKCLKKGFSHFPLDVTDETDEDIRIVLGDNTFINLNSLFRINGKSLFSIFPPEVPGSPVRLNASFYNSAGSEIARIVKNEWQSSSLNWDVNIVGPKITIRQKLGDICLIFRNEPPLGFIIEKINMFYQGFKIVVQDGKGAAIWRPNDTQPILTTFGGIIRTNGGTAFQLSNHLPYKRPKSKHFDF